MKMKKLLLLLLALTMTVIGCDSGSTDAPQSVKYESVDAAGNTYILNITGKTSRAAYAGAAGDSYILTIKQTGQPDKESKGVVSTIKDYGSLTLKPTKADSVPFGVNVSSGKMIAINGTITLEDGNTITAPGAVTPVGSDGVGNVGGPFTSIADMEVWLSAQPVNTEDTPYAVKLNVNDLGYYYDLDYHIKDIHDALTRYVSLDLSGSTFTSLGVVVFGDCDYLTGIIIPASVTSIGSQAFHSPNLTSVTFQGTITGSNIASSAFFGDLTDKYIAGGIGTYTTPETGRGDQVWTKR